MLLKLTHSICWRTSILIGDKWHLIIVAHIFECPYRVIPQETGFLSARKGIKPIGNRKWHTPAPL